MKWFYKMYNVCSMCFMINDYVKSWSIKFTVHKHIQYKVIRIYTGILLISVESFSVGKHKNIPEWSDLTQYERPLTENSKEISKLGIKHDKNKFTYWQ